MKSDDDIQEALKKAQDAVSSALQAHTDLSSEMDKLFSGQSDDALIIARARRLLEVLIVDYYIETYRIAPPYKKALKPLHNLLETMREDGKLSQVLVALCHEVRLLGNQAIHYEPKVGSSQKFFAFDKNTSQAVVLRCAEIVERLQEQSNRSVYGATLSPPFDEMYRHLVSCWEPSLRGMKEGPFPLDEAAEILFRSATAVLSEASIETLEHYEQDNKLPPRLSPTEEDRIRQLRNAGMVKPDGKRLFSPTRSSSITPTHKAIFLIALKRRERDASTVEDLVRRAVMDLASVETQDELLKTLLSLLADPRIKDKDPDVVTKLRNLNLIGHREYFLASSKQVFLTTLGYYVAGKYTSDGAT